MLSIFNKRWPHKTKACAVTRYLGRVVGFVSIFNLQNTVCECVRISGIRKKLVKLMKR